MTVRYNVKQVEYLDSYLRNEHPKNESIIEIKYLLFLPSISRTNTFAGNRGLIISVLPLLMLIITICFLVKDVVPGSSKILIIEKIPFLRNSLVVKEIRNGTQHQAIPAFANVSTLPVMQKHLNHGLQYFKWRFARLQFS
jgi:hypothetical protein